MNLSELGKELMKRINSEIPVRKSDLPGRDEQGVKSVNKQELKDKALEALNNGEIEPDTDIVISWSKENGVPDSEAEDFAIDVLSTYFDQDAAEEDEEEDEEVEKSALREFLKQGKKIENQSKEISEIRKSMGIMMKAIAKIMDAQKAVNEDFHIIKSKLGVIPASNRNPVLNADLSKGNQSQRETSELIQKAVLAGKLSVIDAATWEQKRVLTANAEAVIAEMRKN